jgi:hypothetical protein
MLSVDDEVRESSQWHATDRERGVRPRDNATDGWILGYQGDDLLGIIQKFAAESLLFTLVERPQPRPALLPRRGAGEPLASPPENILLNPSANGLPVGGHSRTGIEFSATPLNFHRPGSIDVLIRGGVETGNQLRGKLRTFPL